jgi:hypothetical protein
MAMSVLLAVAGNALANQLEVGIAKADVTPDLAAKAVFLAGFGHNRRATEIHTPLAVRAIVLKDGTNKVAIASVDVVGLFLPFVESVRKQLPGFDYVLVGATHNHHGPDTLGLWGPNPLKSGVDAAYMAFLEKRIIEAIRAADANCLPAKAVIGRVNAPELLHDGRDPQVKHDELVALLFRDPKTDKPSGVVVQWNCHPETINSKNTKLSADYIASTCAALEAKFQCPVVYLTGTVGGLMTSMHVDVKDDKGQLLLEGSIEKTERYGVLIAELTQRALANPEPIALTPFDVRTKSVLLPVDNPMYRFGRQVGVFDRVMEAWTDDPNAPPGKPLEKVEGRPAVRTEVGRLRLGELDIAIIPGEIYPELVLGKIQDPPEPNADFPDAPMEPGIYAQMTGKYKMIVGLGNDELGYILPKRQWDEKPPYCYGRKTAPYGEVNSLGPETAPILCESFRKMLKNANHGVTTP